MTRLANEVFKVGKKQGYAAIILFPNYILLSMFTTKLGFSVLSVMKEIELLNFKTIFSKSHIEEIYNFNQIPETFFSKIKFVKLTTN